MNSDGLASSKIKTPRVRVCRDCEIDPRRKPRPAPHPGPRCVTHHRAKKKINGERAAEKRWAQNYGITPEQYREILEAQGGGCAICGRPPGRRRLAVDHDHLCCPGSKSCGQCVRGLLCWTENKWLEHIKDDPSTAERAAKYLRYPPAQAILKRAAWEGKEMPEWIKQGQARLGESA